MPFVAVLKNCLLQATNGVGAPFSHSKNAGATFKKRVRAKPGMGTLKRINDQKKATKRPPKAGARNRKNGGAIEKRYEKPFHNQLWAGDNMRGWWEEWQAGRDWH